MHTVVLDYLFQRNLTAALRCIIPSKMYDYDLESYLKHHIEPLSRAEYTFIALSCTHNYLDTTIEAALSARRYNVAAWLSIFISKSEHNNAIWRQMLHEYDVDPATVYNTVPLPIVPVPFLDELLYRVRHVSRQSLVTLTHAIIETHRSSNALVITRLLVQYSDIVDGCIEEIVTAYGPNTVLLAMFTRKAYCWIIARHHPEDYPEDQPEVMQALINSGASWLGAAECAIHHKEYFAAALIQSQHIHESVAIKWPIIDFAMDRGLFEHQLDIFWSLMRNRATRDAARLALRILLPHMRNMPNWIYRRAHNALYTH